MTRWAWAWLPLAFLVMCAGWALTSPPGSSPDDDYHLASIWCAQGIRDGICEESPTDPLARLVPANVVGASDCYRFDAAVNAGCTAATRDDASLVETLRVNETAGLYPGPYYRAMSVLVGPDVERSVLAMRLLNSGLAALLLALLIRVVPAGIRSAALIAVAVTFVPLGLFVVASTNPSGWASVGVALYWAFALALLLRSDWRSRRTWLVAAGTVATALMALASRVDASAYLILATALALVLAGPARVRRAPVSAAVVGVVALLGAFAYLTAGTPGSGVAGEAMGTAKQGGGLLLTNLAYLPALFQGVVGGWALGWNDTVLPPLVPVVGTLVLGALAYRGLTGIDRRRGIAAALALAALVAVPIVFLQKEGLGVGEVVQPRYLLPLLALLVASLSLGPRMGVGLELPRVPAWTLAAALSVSAVLAFWTNAHRYLAGTGVGLFDPKVQLAWLSSVGLPIWLTTLATAAASVAFVSGVFVSSSRSARGA